MRYLEIVCHLQFAKEINWFGHSETILRSVLGVNLRRICCIAKNQETCSVCMVKNSCVYSWLFESPIEKESFSLNGRDRAPHPFILEYDQISTTEGRIKIVLLGKAAYFAPYVISSFRNAGEYGLGRDRIHFAIEYIETEGEEFVGSRFEIEKHIKQWIYGHDDIAGKTIAGIEFTTPCRIKNNGKYLGRLLVQDVLKSIQRRMISLEEFYGDPFSPCLFESFPYSSEENQRWEERKHVSSRTATKMSLGGVVGGIRIHGRLDDLQRSLLRAGEIFHVGKNVAFGLGRMRVIYEEDVDDKCKGTV